MFQPTPAFLPGESHGQRSLAHYSPWGHKELDTTELLNSNNHWIWFLSSPTRDPTCAPCIERQSIKHSTGKVLKYNSFKPREDVFYFDFTLNTSLTTSIKISNSWIVHSYTVGLPWWRRKWQSTPALFPGKSHGWRSLIGYSPLGRRVGHNWATSLSLSHSWTSLVAQTLKNLPAIQETQVPSLIGDPHLPSPGEGNGNSLQCSCLENCLDRGNWVGDGPWGHKQQDTIEWLTLDTVTSLSSRKLSFNRRSSSKALVPLEEETKSKHTLRLTSEKVLWMMVDPCLAELCLQGQVSLLCFTFV